MVYLHQSLIMASCIHTHYDYLPAFLPVKKWMSLLDSPPPRPLPHTKFTQSTEIRLGKWCAEKKVKWMLAVKISHKMFHFMLMIMMDEFRLLPSPSRAVAWHGMGKNSKKRRVELVVSMFAKIIFIFAFFEVPCREIYCALVHLKSCVSHFGVPPEELLRCRRS